MFLQLVVRDASALTLDSLQWKGADRYKDFVGTGNDNPLRYNSRQSPAEVQQSDPIVVKGEQVAVTGWLNLLDKGGSNMSTRKLLL